MMTAADSIQSVLEAGVRAYVLYTSSGVCEYGKECEMCDCNQPESDQRAQDTVAAILPAIYAELRPLIEAELLKTHIDTVFTLITQTESKAAEVGKDHPTLRTVLLIKAQGMQEILDLLIQKDGV